jgi:2-alkenal reductase
MDLEPTQRGALITEVTPDGPADKAGLRGSDRQVEIDGQENRVGGDVIIAVNEEPILDMDDLIAYLTNNTSVGDQITVTVQRDGEQVEVEVTLGIRPGPSSEPAGPQIAPKDQAKAWLGIVGGTMTPEIADAMELPPRQVGVLVEQVQAGSPADQAGLRGSYKPLDINGQMVLVGGDVIIALDGKDVETINDLGALLGEFEPGDEVTLTVLRDGEKVELDVTLGERPG